MYWKQLVEVNNFGFNIITLSAVVIIFFSILEAWGIYKQNQKIKEEKSGIAVSVSWFIYFMFLLLAYLVYGVFAKEGVIIFNGLIFLFVIPIVINLAKFKGFSKTDISLFIICFLGILFMIFFPVKKIMFSIFLSGSVFALALQLFELLKEKCRGNIEPKLVWIYFISTIFFIVYAFCVSDWMLFSVFILTFFLLFAILFFYYRFSDTSEFHDVRDITYHNRIKIGFPSLDLKWKGSKAVFTEHTLEIEGHPVMEDWEDGYMKKLAEIACMNGGEVLEVGFGMGISATYIHEHDISRHTVIEANEEVYKKLIKFSFSAKHSVKPLFGFWQDIISLIPDESFDGVLFDTYPITKEEIHKNHFPFFKEAFRILKDGGVLTYYSDEIEDYSKEHVECLHKAGFLDIQGIVCNVNPPKDCKYWKSDKILAPIIFKGKKRSNGHE